MVVASLVTHEGVAVVAGEAAGPVAFVFGPDGGLECKEDVSGEFDEETKCICHQEEYFMV